MPLNDEDREQLVSYLDGELDEASAQSFEARLNTDPSLRAEAEALKQAWELLDYLPRPQPSGSFTHRTLERLSACRQPTTMIRRRRRWPIGLAGLSWAAALVLAVGLGLGLARWWFTPRPAPIAPPPPEVEQVLRHDLRVIENRRLYESVGDLEFLQALDALGLADEDSLER
jgi:hypothetical protein